MAKRRTKRSHEVTKRCDCRDQQHCSHPWWLRVKVKNEKRQRVNLTELFPSDAVDVAAAKAKDLARKGLIRKGQLVAAQPSDTRPTCRYVATKYAEARNNRKEKYYLDGLMDTDAPDASIKIGDKPIDDVLPRDIKHAAALWKERKKTKAGARNGADAIRHLLQTARHFFKWAKVEGYSTRTPFKDEQGTVLISVGKSRARKRRLLEGEAERILAAADSDMQDFFTAMLETGCRPGELRTLQWCDVHGDHFVVVASKAKDREDREVPIMPVLAKILERRRIGPDGQPLATDCYVFGNPFGEVVSREKLCERWRLTCAAAKIKDLHLHDLRAEFASQLSESKVPVEQVRDALGHSSITMTNTYLRSRASSLKDAYRKRTQHQARKRLKVVKGNGPRLAHDDQQLGKAASS
jgi:integrase